MGSKTTQALHLVLIYLCNVCLFALFVFVHCFTIPQWCTVFHAWNDGLCSVYMEIVVCDSTTSPQLKTYLVPFIWPLSNNNLIYPPAAAVLEQWCSVARMLVLKWVPGTNMNYVPALRACHPLKRTLTGLEWQYIPYGFVCMYGFSFWDYGEDATCVGGSRLIEHIVEHPRSLGFLPP